MIIDIPTPDEFHEAGLNQVYLAWQIALQAVHDFDELSSYSLETDEEASTEYWSRSQPALANAFSLIQQGMELALKGKIASVSPFLLIGRDPKDWPKRVDSEDVAFSEFRTLDASELVKVHNSLVSPRLDASFAEFWEQVRRDRNKIMHSVAPRTFDPGLLVRTILTAIEALFSDVPWARRLSEMVLDGKYAAFGYVDDTQNVVMQQLDDAIRHLDPSEAKRFFGFDKKRRAYVCPHCYYEANRDWQDDWPALAQFPAKARGARSLYCFVCETTTEVERRSCQSEPCRGDVISDGMCLTCTNSQDECLEFDSGLTDESLDEGHRYDFTFARGKFGSGGYSAQVELKLRNDEDARQHALLALNAEHLASWETVTVEHREPLSRLDLPLAVTKRLLGYWRRIQEGVVWHPEMSPFVLPGAVEKPDEGEAESATS